MIEQEAGGHLETGDEAEITTVFFLSLFDRRPGMLSVKQ